MATHGISRRRTAAQWRELIERFSRSGLTRKAFCAQERIGESTLGAWQRRLRNTEPPAGQTGDSQRGVFAELALPGSMAGDRPTSRETPPWDVELDLGDGICLRIRCSRGC